MSSEHMNAVIYTQQLLNEWGVVVGASLFVCLLVAYFTLPKAKPGETMKAKEKYILSKRELRQKENNLIADEVEEFLLRLFKDDKITAERYRHWHLRFGNHLGLRDLLPGKLTPEQMKSAIQARRKQAKTYRPVPFPKETKAVKAKNIIDKVLSKHFL